MNAVKLQLSSAERTLVSDPGWILTKNSILEKTVALLACCGEGFQAALEEREQGVAADKGELAPGAKVVAAAGGVHGEEVEADGSHEADGSREARVRTLRELAATAPKISRGEKYLGLPYVILDYPRQFGREDVLAIRTMFWWGHYFSMTLHLKGRYQALYLPVIRANLGVLSEAGFHIAVSDDEWRHELAEDNYRSLAGHKPTGAASASGERGDVLSGRDGRDFSGGEERGSALSGDELENRNGRGQDVKNDKGREKAMSGGSNGGSGAGDGDGMGDSAGGGDAGNDGAGGTRGGNDGEGGGVVDGESGGADDSGRGGGGGKEDWLERILAEHPFLKFSVCYGLHRWDDVQELLTQSFRVLVKVLTVDEGQAADGLSSRAIHWNA